MEIKNLKNKPGVHIKTSLIGVYKGGKTFLRKKYYWQIVGDAGNVVARSEETYAKKQGVLESIREAHDVFRFCFDGKYIDHSGASIKVGKTWR